MRADCRIQLHNVTVRFGRRIALEAITGEFAPGSLTAIVGANGAGKSTLLAAIAGLVRPAKGTIDCDARDRLAYLPQVTAIDRDFPLTISELITLGAWRELGAFRSPNNALRQRVASVAETVGLTTQFNRLIREVSAGELQRALFARLMLQGASIILLDEPFGGVDAPTISALLDLIGRWHEEQRTVAVVLHDLDLVRARFPSTLVLAQRCLAWGPTDAALLAMAA
jgi:zinc/manganese transport system ATP-binding protein